MKLISVMAVSLNGKIARTPEEDDELRRSYGFTCSEDHEFVRSQIKNADAVITGANSMRASRTAWEQKGRNNRFPTWVVLTNQGLKPDCGFMSQEHIPRMLISSKKLNLDLNFKNLQLFEYHNLPPGQFVLDLLKSQGCKRVLLFGGGMINKIFYQENLVDEVNITICPVIIGSACAPNLVDLGGFDYRTFELISSQVKTNHVFLRYRSLKNIF